MHFCLEQLIRWGPFSKPCMWAPVMVQLVAMLLAAYGGTVLIRTAVRLGRKHGY